MEPAPIVRRGIMVLGIIYLIPSVLSEAAIETIPPYVIEAVKNCQVIFAENERTALSEGRSLGHEK